MRACTDYNLIPMFKHLLQPDGSLFFSRNDPDDPRMGDATARDRDAFPGNARVVLVGVPQDIGVERNGGRPGAAQAPEAIRKMLYRLTPYNLESGVLIPSGALFDAGNLYCYGDLEEIHGRLQEVVEGVCRQGLIPLVLGGGHDITYAAASGVHAVHGKLGMLNFDAHLDVRLPFPHRHSGTSFRMLIEEEKMEPSRFVEFGIQPFANAKSHADWLTDGGGTIRTLDLIRRVGLPDALHSALRVVSSGTHPFYGTLDIDGVCAADAPGVSATMPDGFAAQDLLAVAAALGSEPSCVALDIAEVNPTFDVDNRTAKLAAHAVLRFVSGKVAHATT